MIRKRAHATTCADLRTFADHVFVDELVPVRLRRDGRPVLTKKSTTIFRCVTCGLVRHGGGEYESAGIL